VRGESWNRNGPADTSKYHQRRRVVDRKNQDINLIDDGSDLD